MVMILIVMFGGLMVYVGVFYFFGEYVVILFSECFIIIYFYYLILEFFFLIGSVIDGKESLFFNLLYIMWVLFSY